MTEEPSLPPTTDTRGDVVIITGLAGAGRETAAHALEDMGWYVVYNIAPQLIGTLYELRASTVGRENRFAVVVDPRSGPFFNELSDVVAELRLGAEALEVRVAGVGEPDAAVGLHDDVVRRVERPAAVGVDHGRAVTARRIDAGDRGRLLLADEQ